jgi:hypothetical protein
VQNQAHKVPVTRAILWRINRKLIAPKHEAMRFACAKREHNVGREGSMHWLGTTLIEIYEAGAEDPIKIELLDQVVSIMRRKDRRVRVQEIESLMRGWQQMRGG